MTNQANEWKSHVKKYALKLFNCFDNLGFIRETHSRQ